MATSHAVLRGPNISLWVRNHKTPVPSFPVLKGAQSPVDVAVIGGGITGLSTALQLRDRGKSVALVEAAKIGSGVTGNSTSKITSLHRIKYTTLLSSFKESDVRKYAEMNEAGLNFIEMNVKKYGIDCDFMKAPNCTYTTDPGKVDTIKKEVEAACKAGLNAKLVTEVAELPFKIAAGVQVDNQAQFNSYSYCLGLAQELSGAGCNVYEGSRVKSVSKISPHRVETEEGFIEAKDVVLATHLPILDIGGQFATCEPTRSYCIAVSLEDESKVPMGMYITAEGGQETISLRPAHTQEGRKVLIVAGQGHKVGAEVNTIQRYQNLEDWARKNYKVKEVVSRWSAHDYIPADSMYYIGHLCRGINTLYTATGFQKWGIAAGSASGIIIADLITGRPNEWASVMDARRWDITESAKKIVSMNLDVGKHFIADRVSHYFSREKVEDLAKDEGSICKFKGKTVAAYRDQEGVLHSLSPRCTHLGCHVEWNNAERSWDCPCHGSRFNYDGAILHGPATDPLKKMDW